MGNLVGFYLTIKSLMTSRISLSLWFDLLVSWVVLIELCFVRHILLTFLLVSALFDVIFFLILFGRSIGYLFLRTSVRSGIRVVLGASSPAIDLRGVSALILLQT